MAISSNLSKQWHENRPPQAELFRVVKLHFVSYGTTRLKKEITEIDILQSEIKYLKGKQDASNRHR